MQVDFIPWRCNSSCIPSGRRLEESKQKALMRAPVGNNIRSKRTIVDANWEKYVDKSQGSSNTTNKNVRSNTSSSQESSSSTFRINCHTCHGFVTFVQVCF